MYRSGSFAAACVLGSALLLPPLLVHAEETPVSPNGEESAPQKPEATPVKQSLGSGSIGLLIQSWFTIRSDSRFFAGSTSPAFPKPGQPDKARSTFRLRRVEMSYQGKLLNWVKYRAMIDPSIIQNGPIAVKFGNTDPAAGPVTGTVTVKDILQDAWVGVVVPYHEIKMGQFKIPLTREGSGSSSKLDFAERSIMARTFGDQRDLGLMVASSKVPYVDYQVAVVNGTGKNVYDNALRKDFVARVVAKPINGLSVGGSGYLGKSYDPTLPGGRKKQRLGAEAAFEMAGASVKAEYMVGAERRGSAGATFEAHPAGYYATLGYRWHDLQGVARYDAWNSDTDTSIAQCRPGSATTPAGPAAGSNRCSKLSTISLGLNYNAATVLNGAKLQLDYYLDHDRVQDVSASEVFLVAQVKY